MGSKGEIFSIEPLTFAYLDQFRALFDESGCGCFCRYWHFEGSKNEWQERLAFDKEANLAEMRVALARQREDAGGLLCLSPKGEALGWMKWTRRAALPKLQNLPVYRSAGLKADAPDTFCIGCFLVHPAHRGKGIADALLRRAIGLSRERGGRWLEAYPRASSEALGPHEAWMGPYEMFLRHGFHVAAGELPYPIMRRAI